MLGRLQLNWLTSMRQFHCRYRWLAFALFLLVLFAVWAGIEELRHVAYAMAVEHAARWLLVQAFRV